VNNFYVSFGQTHTHNINGTILNRDCVLRIYAESSYKARNIAFALFDGKFSILYKEKPNMKLFPRGIIDINGEKINE
jgi:hypothetical protein